MSILIWIYIFLQKSNAALSSQIDRISLRMLPLLGDPMEDPIALQLRSS